LAEIIFEIGREINSPAGEYFKRFDAQIEKWLGRNHRGALLIPRPNKIPPHKIFTVGGFR